MSNLKQSWTFIISYTVSGQEFRNSWPVLAQIFSPGCSQAVAGIRRWPGPAASSSQVTPLSNAACLLAGGPHVLPQGHLFRAAWMSLWYSSHLLPRAKCPTVEPSYLLCSASEVYTFLPQLPGIQVGYTSQRKDHMRTQTPAILGVATTCTDPLVFWAQMTQAIALVSTVSHVIFVLGGGWGSLSLHVFFLPSSEAQDGISTTSTTANPWCPRWLTPILWCFTVPLCHLRNVSQMALADAKVTCTIYQSKKKREGWEEG